MTYRNFLYCGRYKLYFLHIESFLPFISCIFHLASLFLCLSITPHAGSDHTRQQFMSLIGRFQPTLPLRGVTAYGAKYVSGHVIFQSTLPMRGVTGQPWLFIVMYDISIHTPHAGSDCLLLSIRTYLAHFNPHSPCGE